MTLTVITPKGRNEYYGLSQADVNRQLRNWFEWLNGCPRVSIRFEVTE